MKTEYKFINLTYLNEISDNSTTIKCELIEIFLNQIPEFENDFETSFETKNWKKLAQTAHKAKSSVLSMGLISLGKIDLKNLELFAYLTIKNNLEEKINQTEKEVFELASIKSNLSAYSEETIHWLEANLSENKIEELIKKFSDICKNATLELNCELNNPVF